jgi:hypothetical protein
VTISSRAAVYRQRAIGNLTMVEPLLAFIVPSSKLTNSYGTDAAFIPFGEVVALEKNVGIE